MERLHTLLHAGKIKYGSLPFTMTVCLLLVMSVALGGSSLSAEELTIVLDASDYWIIDKENGQRVEMEGFGYLREPGKPMLPAKNFMIALPPGGKVRSVEVTGVGARQLPGTYQILPTPPIMPLADPGHLPQLVEKMQREWEKNREVIYSSDRVYPEDRGELKGSGGLRKYAYASVSFHPFDFFPLSGRLVFYERAIVTVSYTVPPPGSIEAKAVEAQKMDTLADRRASQSFINYQEMEFLYRAGGPKLKAPGPSQQPTIKGTYLIVTTSALLNTVLSSKFLPWKQSLGHKVIVAYTTGGSTDLAQDIRYFVRDRYIPWSIGYVLLIGDHASIPMRYCYPDPSNHSHYPHDPFQFGGEVPTDYYFADLTSEDEFSWDSDGDGFYGEYKQDQPDFMAEVYVGRIPTDNAARVAYSLAKIVDFEQDKETWKSNILHVGAMIHFDNQDHSGIPEVDGANCMNVIETDLMAGLNISHYSEQAGLKPSDFPWPALTETAFTNDWRNGQYGIVNWFGHGSAIGAARMVWTWDDGDGVPEYGEISMPAFIQTVSNLDDDYPSIVFALSCLVGYPESNAYGRLGVDLLTKPQFGSAAAVLSAARGAAAAVGWPASPGGVQSMCYEFNRRILNGHGVSKKVGPALYDSKFYCNHHYGWDHYYEYKNLYDYNLYGDPAMVREGIEP